MTSEARGEATRVVHLGDDLDMRSFVGPRDEVIRAVERGFPTLEVHLRGSTVTLAGPSGEADLAASLMAELAAVARSGQPLTADAVDRAIGMLRDAGTVTPSRVLTTNILSSGGAPSARRRSGRRTTWMRSTAPR